MRSKFTLEQLMDEFAANSEGFRQNNEALRRLLDQAKRGEISEQSFRARADQLFAEGDVLKERRRELGTAYKDARERLRIARVARGQRR